jgi:hypothetical protein
MDSPTAQLVPAELHRSSAAKNAAQDDRCESEKHSL